MKKDRLLNPNILVEVASLGHTDYLCIADCGLPIPKGVRVIDVSLVAGIPSFLDVLKAVNEELVIESIIVASEIDTINPTLMIEINSLTRDIPIEKIPHREFKNRTQNAKCIIRTGETTPYANIILVGGVNF